MIQYKRNFDNQDIILKTGRDIFVKIQKNLTSKQADHMGSSSERATAQLHTVFFAYFSKILISFMEQNKINFYNQDIVLKTGRDIFVKIQKNLTSKQTEDMGSSYERATAHFHIFLHFFFNY